MARVKSVMQGETVITLALSDIEVAYIVGCMGHMVALRVVGEEHYEKVCSLYSVLQDSLNGTAGAALAAEFVDTASQAFAPSASSIDRGKAILEARGQPV